MLQLNEQQIDRVIRQRRFCLFFGLVTIGLPMLLPRGWTFGLFSGFMLFSLGIYGLAFRKWRTEPGLWMLAVLLTLTLGPCWLYFEVLHWRGILGQPAGQPINLQQLKFSIDAFVALVLFAHTLQFALSVAIQNWKRTRIAQQTIGTMPDMSDVDNR